LLRRFLDKKVTKPERSESMTTSKNNNEQGINQGLELMSDKFVKALFAAAQAPMKNREERAALGSSKLNVIAQALTS